MLFALTSCWHTGQFTISRSFRSPPLFWTSSFVAGCGDGNSGGAAAAAAGRCGTSNGDMVPSSSSHEKNSSLSLILDHISGGARCSLKKKKTLLIDELLVEIVSTFPFHISRKPHSAGFTHHLVLMALHAHRSFAFNASKRPSHRCLGLQNNKLRAQP